MKNPAIWLIIILIIAVGLAWIPLLGLFKDYCERVATIEGRMGEFLSINVDDGGLNRFERQQFVRVFRRHYLAYDDAQLTAMGNALRKWFLASYFAIAVLIATLFAIFFASS